jgi:hypothetical protein
MTDATLIEKISPETPRTRRPVLWTGLSTGVLLVVVMLGALVAANRVAGLEPYALERNAASYGLFLLCMLIPVARFWKRPLQMFASATIAWVLFVVAYDAAGMVFTNLFESLRHNPGFALMDGIVVYGICAVGSWVGGMIVEARRHPIAPARKAARRIP